MFALVPIKDALSTYGLSHVSNPEMRDVEALYVITVIPAPIAYTNFVAVKKLVVEIRRESVCP